MLINNETILNSKDYKSDINRLSDFLSQHTEGSRFAVILSNTKYIKIVLSALNRRSKHLITIDPELSTEEIKLLLEQNKIENIISENMYVNRIDPIFWSLKNTKNYILIDKYSLSHSTKERDFKILWDYIAEESSEEINDYGWQNSYTREPFTIKEMQQYIDNFKVKINPYLNKKTRLLEVGCGHGIVFSELVNRVAYYFATDISEVIINKNRQRAIRENMTNIVFDRMAASEISRLDGREFDVVICSSVIHYFPDCFYLERFIKDAISVLGEKGIIYLDDIIDLTKKKELEESISEYKMLNSNKNSKTDWSKDLFVHPDFFKFLQSKYPEIVACERSKKIGQIDNELVRYRYDVILSIDKTVKSNIKVTDWNKSIYSEPDFIKFLTSTDPMNHNSDIELDNTNYLLDYSETMVEYINSPNGLSNLDLEGGEDLFSFEIESEEESDN